MGLEIKITGSDGRRFNSIGEMVGAEGKSWVDDRVAAVQRAVSSQTCPIHGERPTVRVRRSGDETRFEFGACCEDLRDRAQQAADTAFRR